MILPPPNQSRQPTPDRRRVDMPTSSVRRGCARSLGLMEHSTSESELSTRDRRSYVVCVCLCAAIGIVAMIREADILWNFYVGTASLAPGTAIRPLGVSFALVSTEIGALLLGSACVVPAVALGLRYRSWARIGAAIVAVVLCAIPMVVGTRVFQEIVHMRGLLLLD
jgi:hypothetical protein